MCDLQKRKHFAFSLDLKIKVRFLYITLFALLTALPPTFHFVHRVCQVFIILWYRRNNLPHAKVRKKFTNQLQAWCEDKFPEALSKLNK